MACQSASFHNPMTFDGLCRPHLGRPSGASLVRAQAAAVGARQVVWLPTDDA